jgi:LacI family transcriptional regulator
MTKPSRPPTITDVAIAAGVDRSSVSRAFSRPDLLRAETVVAIRAAADRLGYAPNRNARALSTGRHGNIALIVPDIADLAFPPLIRAAQLEAYRAGLCMFIGNSDEDARLEERLIAQFSGQVDGLLLAAPRLSVEAIKAVASQKLTVLINRDIPGLPRILVDSGTGINEALAYLHAQGHRRLVYVGAPRGSWLDKVRRTAVVNAAAKHGLSLDTVLVAASAFYEAGRAAAKDIARSPATAVLAFNDIVALGVIAGLYAAGVGVPGAVSVVSCEEVLGAATTSQLTTVGTRMAEAGKIAVGLLVDAVETSGLSDARYTLDTHLIVRGSSGAAPTR